MEFHVVPRWQAEEEKRNVDSESGRTDRDQRRPEQRRFPGRGLALSARRRRSHCFFFARSQEASLQRQG